MLFFFMFGGENLFEDLGPRAFKTCYLHMLDKRYHVFSEDFCFLPIAHP